MWVCFVYTCVCLNHGFTMHIQCNGQAIDWRYIVQLYEENAGSAVNMGVCVCSLKSSMNMFI